MSHIEYTRDIIVSILKSLQDSSIKDELEFFKNAIKEDLHIKDEDMYLLNFGNMADVVSELSPVRPERIVQPVRTYKGLSLESWEKKTEEQLFHNVNLPQSPLVQHPVVQPSETLESKQVEIPLPHVDVPHVDVPHVEIVPEVKEVVPPVAEVHESRKKSEENKTKNNDPLAKAFRRLYRNSKPKVKFSDSKLVLNTKFDDRVLVYGAKNAQLREFIVNLGGVWSNNQSAFVFKTNILEKFITQKDETEDDN
jgi:hypothetical protein